MSKLVSVIVWTGIAVIVLSTLYSIGYVMHLLLRILEKAAA